MSVSRFQFVRPFAAIAMVAGSTIYAIAQQPPTPTRVRGTSEAVDGAVLVVKTVVFSPETPVVTYVPAGKSDLKPGAKVIAFMKKLPDGSLETSRVSVGRDGLTPPM